MGTNLIGGERGLASYFEKRELHQELILKESKINEELQDLKHKIKLISDNDLDYLDMMYREKLRYGTKDEIIIKRYIGPLDKKQTEEIKSIIK